MAGKSTPCYMYFNAINILSSISNTTIFYELSSTTMMVVNDSPVILTERTVSICTVVYTVYSKRYEQINYTNKLLCDQNKTS